MTGPVSIYAIAEMNRRAEEYTLKVRSELFRIGCTPERLQVLRQGVYLQMKYQQQIILVPPNEILGVLKKLPAGTEDAEIWEKVCEHSYQLDRQSKITRGWVVTVFASLLALLLFLVLLIKF
jgi:hypothetical protein